MAINKKLIHFNKREDFDKKSKATSANDTTVDILYSSIVFIKDTQEIWTHGKIYPAPYTKEELDAFLADKADVSTFNQAISDIAIYPFDGFTNSFDNETSRPNGTILWGPSGFKIKVNGEWTDNQSDLPNYIKPGLGGGNVRNDRLFRYNNLLYRFDALGDIGNTLVPIVPLATDETHGIIKVNGVTDNINKSIYTNSDGEIGISIGNSNIKGISIAAAEELEYGNISFDTDSTSLTPDVNLYVYDGTRDLVSTSNSLIAEKGLVKALEPYVKTDENGKVNPNVLPIAKINTLGGVQSSINNFNVSSATASPCVYSNNNGELFIITNNSGRVTEHFAPIDNIPIDVHVGVENTNSDALKAFTNIYYYDGRRPIDRQSMNFVLENGLYNVLQSYPKLTNGLIPAQYLPSYVDDVLEFESLSAFPTTGETSKIYIDTTENRTYRWSGTQYTEIGKSLALGETSSTAYAGDKGAANAADIDDIKNILGSLDDLYVRYTTDGKINSSVIPFDANFYYGEQNNSIVTSAPVQTKVKTVTNGLTGIDELVAETMGYYFDGSREPNINATNLVQEKGLRAVLANKVTIVEGKDLSSNDYTDADKTKLTGLREYTLATNSDIDAIING